jgi:hypothetical protein
MPFPLGRVSRERMARHIVGLIEKPRRALFMSRLYDVPVFLNRWFPEFVDWTSETWVRRKRKDELPPSATVAPVHYERSVSFVPILGAISMLALITRVWLKKR